MNKFYKVLATATILAMAAVPVASAHQSQQVPSIAVCPPGPVDQADLKKDVSILNANAKSNQNKQDKEHNENKENKENKHNEDKEDKEHKEHKEDKEDKEDKEHKEQRHALGTVGQITNYTNDKNGKYITVVGRGVTAQDRSDMILAITKDTKIINSKGKKVSIDSIIKGGKSVKVFYGPVMTKSLPPRGTALTVIEQDQAMNGVIGKVTEAKNSKVVVTGKNIYNGKEETIVLQLTGHTPIVDQNGKKIERKDITKGMSIEAFYGPHKTKSVPAQAHATYIIVNKEQQVQELGTSGVIVEKNDNQITVVGTPAAQGGQKEIKLNVTDNTVIVNEKGEKLTKDALKANQNVDVFYGPAMTFSLPPMGNATKIVVKGQESVKAEGTIEKSDFAKGSQIYLNVNSDDNKVNDIVLNINKDTKIVNLHGNQVELKPGMKIVAFHSQIMTMSIPGITDANMIVITEEQQEQLPGTDGIVTDVNGDRVTVVGNPLKQGGQQQIILTVDKDTVIVNEKGQVLSKDAIKPNVSVEATYGPIMTASFPAMSHASKIVVKGQETVKIEGTIMKDRTNDKQLYVNVKSDNETSNDVILNVTKDTKIVNIHGGEAKLTPGTKIVAYHSPIMTMSLPGITNAELIIVTEAQQEQLPGTDGIVTDVNGDRVTVVGNPLEQGGQQQIILTVDKDTVIVNEKGETLSKDAIKPNVSVEATYGPIMTMSFPAMSHASKIVVKGHETVKIEGTIMKDRTNDKQLYVNVKSDNESSNDVILNVTKDTKIVNIHGGEAKLTPGTKIVAYHSPIMTKSLPGITNAELIVVVSE
ncbi:hypothetical protein [Paenibacillus terrigena]|uniref:hypothetical protein n=1 Tax=Paenibacillus terrigena TaxID=369333 RepID=UPI0028D47733|nr:hypothetical protein [Paenibacillus terrigena]